MRSALTLTILLAFTLIHPRAGLVQGETLVSVKYNARGKVIRISNMNDSLKNDYTCQIKTHVGTIVALKYIEDETEPYAIIVQLRNGRHIFIGLDEDLYPGLSEADRSHLEVTLVTGKRVRVRAYGCGVSGRGDLQSSSIEFL